MELFENAKNAVSIASFFECELGGKPHKTNLDLRFDVCPCCGEGKGSLKVSVKPQTWRCYRCGKGGSVVDAAAAHWGIEPTAAAIRLAGDNRERYPAIPVAQPDDHDGAEREARDNALQEVITILKREAHRNANDPTCMAYLLDERKLPRDVVTEALAREVIGFLPGRPADAVRFLVEVVGKDLLEQSGLWKPGSKLPGICYRPIIAFLPGGTSAEFRLARPPRDSGEKKAIRYGKTVFPWFWRGQEQRVMVVEGWIDMLSAVALGFRGHIVAVPGCNNWKPEWFQSVHQKRDVTMFYVALDNDVGSDLNPGQEWAMKMSQEMSKLGLPNVVKVPPQGMDINDILKERLREAT